MSKIEVDVTVKADVAKVWIDGTQITLRNGSGRAAVAPGEHHAFSWAVRGAAGTGYSVKITAPAEAKLTHTDTFDRDQFDAGLAWFNVIAAVCLLLVAHTAFAQHPDAVMRMADAAALTRHTMTASGSAVDLAPAFGLEATTAGETASGRIGMLLGGFSLVAGASAPFGGTGAAPLADFDGLRRKASATAAGAWRQWSVRDAAPQLDAACRAAARPKGCSLLELKRDDSPEGRDALRHALAAIDTGTLYLAGASGTLAPETFIYISPNDGARTRAHRTSWSASANAGVLFPGGLSVTGIYTRERAYEAQTHEQLCTPGPSPASLVCSDEIIGAPNVSAKTNRISVEARRVFTAFGISPKVTYDDRRHATGVQLPLYFLQDPSGGLRGGIILGWRSDTRAFTASAVVGQILSLIGY